MIIPRNAANPDSRPFWFNVTKDYAESRGVGRVPGVFVKDDGVWCARDTVEIAARLLEYPIPEGYFVPWDSIEAHEWPGLERFKTTFASMWKHQPAGSAALASHSWFVEGDTMRSGKNSMCLGGMTLVDAKRPLILTLGTPKRGWLEDNAKWFGTDALALDGRAGRDAWYYCAKCMGKGLKLGSDVKAAVGSGSGAGSGSGSGLVDATLAGLSTASLKRNLNRCEKCRGKGWYRPDDIVTALATAPLVVANYDILIGHREKTLNGQYKARVDLRGWTPLLLKYRRPDLVILDEPQKVGKKGWRRADTRKVCLPAQFVWAATATPTSGPVLDLWYLLDLISGGLVGLSKKLWASRYAEGFQSDFGFSIPKNGCSPLADTELADRLNQLMIKRPRSEIMAHMPPHQRQVMRVDNEATDADQLHDASENESERATTHAAWKKISAAVDYIMDELADGAKVVGFTHNRDLGHEITTQIRKAVESKTRGARLRHLDVEVWNGIGKTYEQRVDMADKYSAHQGPAYFGVTIDGFQTGRSLLGTRTAHFFQLHYDPTAVQQCEARSLTFDRLSSMTSMFWVLTGSADEHMIEVIIPKLEVLEGIMGDRDAGSMRNLFSPQETLEEVWARHTAHLKGMEE